MVHTNAAYCRLSGIDSHTVVGKPISSLLRIPDPQTLAEVEEDYQQQEELKIDETHEFDSATGASIENHELSHQGNDQSMLSESRETQGLSAAAAAGRARAASSQEDSVERLIATSGFGRYNIISLYAKPLLGSQITMATPSENAHVRRSREEGSNGSSITSIGEGSYRQLPCKLSLYPYCTKYFSTTKLTFGTTFGRFHGRFACCKLPRGIRCCRRKRARKPSPQNKASEAPSE